MLDLQYVSSIREVDSLVFLIAIVLPMVYLMCPVDLMAIHTRNWIA